MWLQGQSSRSRYKTRLPFAAEAAQYKWTREQCMNRQDDDFARIDNTQSAECPPRVSMRSYGTTSSSGSTTGRRAVVVTDSYLPYQRQARTDLQKLAAELDLVDSRSTSLSDRSLTQQITPITESSSKSDTSPSLGQSTNGTSPEESPEPKDTALQPQPSFALPGNQARRRSMSGTSSNRQPQSPSYMNDYRSPQGYQDGTQSRTRSGSVTKSRQHESHFLLTTNRSPLPIPPRSASREKTRAKGKQSSGPKLRPLSPGDSVPNDTVRSPSRGRSMAEQAIYEAPTRLQKRPDLDTLLQPGSDTTTHPRPPSRSRIPRPVASRTFSSEPASASPTVRRIAPNSPAFETNTLEIPSQFQPRIRDEPPASARSKDYFPASQASSQATTPAKKSLQSRSDPAIQSYENPETRKQQISPIWQAGSPKPNHALLSSKRTARVASLWRPPSVWYENVDGVSLSTRPKCSKDSRGGLSIPEIEAADIRQITPSRRRLTRHSELDFECEFADREEAFAPPPPAIGPDMGQVRSISPRPARESRDLIFFDNYSRAAEDEMPNQRANPPRARRSESISRMNVSVPEVIREMPIAESEEFADFDDDSSDSGAAMPPVVARSRSLEEQDAERTGRTDHVKSLLGGIMKGLSHKTKKVQGDVIPHYKSRDGIASNNSSRTSTMIWSPPKATGYYSDDEQFGVKRVSGISDGSRNSAHFPRTSASAS